MVDGVGDTKGDLEATLRARSAAAGYGPSEVGDRGADIKAIRDDMRRFVARGHSVLLTLAEATAVLDRLDRLDRLDATKEWVNSDVGRMALDLTEQADAIPDEQDPTGMRRAALLRASANMTLAYAELTLLSNLVNTEDAPGACRLSHTKWPDPVDVDERPAVDPKAFHSDERF